MTNKHATILETSYRLYYLQCITKHKESMLTLYNEKKSSLHLINRLKNYYLEIGGILNNWLSNINSDERLKIAIFSDRLKDSHKVYRVSPIKNFIINELEILTKSLSKETLSLINNSNDNFQHFNIHLIHLLAEYNSYKCLHASIEEINRLHNDFENIEVEMVSKQSFTQSVKNDFQLVTPSEKERLKSIVDAKITHLYKLRDTISHEYEKCKLNLSSYTILFDIINEEFFYNQIDKIRDLIEHYQDVYSEIESLSTESLKKIRIANKVSKRDVLRVIYAMKSSGMIKVPTGGVISNVFENVTSNDWYQLLNIIKSQEISTDGDNVISFISELLNIYGEEFKIKLISELKTKKSNK